MEPPEVRALERLLALHRGVAAQQGQPEPLALPPLLVACLGKVAAAAVVVQVERVVLVAQAVVVLVAAVVAQHAVHTPLALAV